jgi:tight adherence protein C
MMSGDTLSLVTALVVFGAVLFLVLGLIAGGSGGSVARARLEALKRGPAGYEPEPDDAARPFSQRVLLPMLQGAAGGLGKLLPRSLLSGVERQLVIAGEPMTLQGFLVMVLVSTAAASALSIMIVIVAGMTGIFAIAIIGFMAFIGFFLPFQMVRGRAGGRKAAIIRSLPDAFDLITTCVEAGLGLDAALARVAEKVEGPFSQELSRALRDVALGKSRRDALKELGERTDVPDLISFTHAVIQAEAMGSSVGTVLRVQSEQLRVRRRQRAEQQAYKAPVKMLFPLVLCIFPTLFIVILGPAGITISQNFPGSK